MTTNLAIGFTIVAILTHLQESTLPYGLSLATIQEFLRDLDGIWLDKKALQRTLDELIESDFVVQQNYLYSLDRETNIVVKILKS